MPADSDALTALSNKCPLIDGAAVYKARALRSLMTGELLVYTDMCGGVSDAGGGEEGGDGGDGGDGGGARRLPSGLGEGQQYSLLPNPNEGAMQLVQMLEDRAPVSVTVYNAIGQTVYKSTRVFEEGQAGLNLNIAAGVYHITLRDSAGRIYQLKFIKR